MSKADQAGSGQTDNTGSGDSDNVEVKYTPEQLTQKLVATSNEAKKHRLAAEALKQQLAEAEKKLNDTQEVELQKQGKFQEMYEKAKAENEALSRKLADKDTKYAYNIVTAKLAQEASILGCKKTDDLIQLMSAKGMMGELEVDDNFNISQDSVKSVLDKAQKELDYLFGKAAPVVKDGVTRTTIQGAKTLSEMNLSEKMAEFKKITAK